jgi:hypothetical protein
MHGARARQRPTRAAAHSRCAALSSLALPILAAAPAGRERIRYVTDRDTFRLRSGERIPIAGIHAAEAHVDRTKCRAELALGVAAATRARALLDGRIVGFECVGRSYNRTVARVMLDSRDVADILVRMGVSQRWLRHQPKPDWCGATRRKRNKSRW